MADLWFGRADPDQVAATGRSLRDDRFLFKLKDGLVIPNPPEVVELLKEQHDRELARRQEAEEIGAWLKAVWRKARPRPAPGKTGWSNSCARWRCGGPRPPIMPRARPYLDKARLNPAEAPFRLLVRLGVFQEDEDLDLHRLEVPLEFSPEALALARQLAQTSPPDLYAAQRRDLTDLEIITIDGERTRDFDDALSLEEVPEGWRLGIHIADVSAQVSAPNPPGSGGPGPGHLHLPAGAAAADAAGGTLGRYRQPAGPPGAPGLKLSGDLEPGRRAQGLGDRPQPY